MTINYVEANSLVLAVGLGWFVGAALTLAVWVSLDKAWNYVFPKPEARTGPLDGWEDVNGGGWLQRITVDGVDCFLFDEKELSCVPKPLAIEQ